MPSIEEALGQLLNKDIFLVLDREVADFTSDEPVSISCMTDGLQIAFPLGIKNDKIKYARSALFGVMNGVVIGWDIKELFSYFRQKLSQKCPRTARFLT